LIVLRTDWRQDAHDSATHCPEPLSGWLEVEALLQGKELCGFHP
jgi:hypothetical protein